MRKFSNVTLLVAVFLFSQSVLADSLFVERKNELRAKEVNFDRSKLNLSKIRSGQIYTASYKPEINPVNIPLSKLHSWIVKVQDSKGIGFNGTLKFSGDMPLHLHGFPSDPKVTKLSDGHFKITGLRFHMPGWWQITCEMFSLNSDQATPSDKIIFDLFLQ